MNKKLKEFMVDGQPEMREYNLMPSKQGWPVYVPAIKHGEHIVPTFNPRKPQIMSKQAADYMSKYSAR